MTSIIKDVTIGDCRLILGDCLEVMPLLGEFDAVVTDPPYGIGFE
jgi:DNA modification methylase